jgi:ferritin
MAFSSTLEKAFNEQITLEFTSAYEYLAMSAWLESASLPGMAHWMRLQSEEEWSHAMKFYRFVLDRDGTVELGPIGAPKRDYDGPLAVFEQSLAHERRVTASINDLYSAATEERDYASLPLLDWFVNEQVEEEATVTQVIEDLRRSEGSPHALLMLDRELGARQGEEH